MNTTKNRNMVYTLMVAFCLFCGPMLPAAIPVAPNTSCHWYKASATKVERELVAQYGEAQRSRIQRGLTQVGQFWRPEDGDAATCEAFVRQNFAGTQEALDALFSRFEHLMEKLNGHLTELRYEFRLQADLDRGPILPVDEAFAAYELGAHVTDDFFANKLAFMVLLNFPLCNLDQCLAEGETWSRRQWAEVRLAQQFSKRIPASVQQGFSDAVSEADIYISQYNICMHHILDEKGKRLFPAKLRLSSHWGLRDEIKAQYNNGTNGLVRQRLIQKILEKVIDQSIPAAVINNPLVDWTPASNEVRPSTVSDIEADPSCKKRAVNNVAEPDTRYAKWLKIFQACRKVDPYSPTAPTLIARRFEEDRQMSEARVKAMLEQMLTSPLLAEVARLIEKRIGRPLEPFDIWYEGFRPPLKHSQEKLDAMVKAKYPTPEALREGLPEILLKLGFTPERAAFLKENIVVQNGRGSGHAMGGAMRGQPSRMRVRFDRDGLLFNNFNVAMHELGHNVEQTFSLNLIDHTLLQGVPNTAFTEGFAMFLQGYDLEMLGLAKPDAMSEALETVNTFWATCEIAIMGLCDMAVWHWLYEHPEATPAELKAATLEIARNLWNTYYAPIIGHRDCILPGVYSHMIHCVLYVPDYPVGHLIAFQIAEQMKRAGAIGPEFERMTKMGNVLPDLWMKHATGAPVGPDALLNATRQALDTIKH